MKYNQAGIFEEEENQWWLQFLESFGINYGQTPDELPTWPLDTLPKVSSLTPGLPQPATRVSDKIEQLHSAERDNLPQV